MNRPQILVIDDLIGKTGHPARISFLRSVGYYPVIGGTQPVSDYSYQFEFHSGQTEAGMNSVQAVINKVGENWLTSDGQWKKGDGIHWALILLDVQFDQSSSTSDDGLFGFVLLNALRLEFGSDLPVIMMTTDTEETRRQMANFGEADGFLDKRELNEEKLRHQILSVGLIEDNRPTGIRLIGRSIELLKTLREARRFAFDPRGCRVVYGETGSGKTALAAYIAHHCNREGRLITWTAQPTNDELNRDQLFGHWVGAFSGADTSEPGVIERAHGGVFLLDEVADLTPAAQQLMLEFRRRDEQGLRRMTRLGNFPTQASDRKGNAIEQARGSIRGLAFNDQGHNVDIPKGQPRGNSIDHIRVDVVLLFATNKPLWDETFRRKEIRFREDLYIELGSPIHFPPLNHRKEDIEPLFKHFLARFIPEQTPKVNQEVIEILETRDWGNRNVADLIRIAEYTAFAFGKDFSEILVRCLPPDVRIQKQMDRTSSASNTETLISTIVLPTAIITQTNTEPSKYTELQRDIRCGLALNENQRLRERIQLFSEALNKKKNLEDATGALRDYSPKRACDLLFGINVSTTEAKRLTGDIIGSILEPNVTYERALVPRGLAQFQQDVKENIVLVLWYQWACEIKGYTDEFVNQRLREYFQATSTRSQEILNQERKNVERQIQLRKEKIKERIQKAAEKRSKNTAKT